MSEAKILFTLDQSAASLRGVLAEHGKAVTDIPAWGYSPLPLASLLPDGRIKVVTYHLEGEYQTDVLDTEADVVTFLFTEPTEGGTWEPGEWHALG